MIERHDAAIDEALARAVVYRALSDAFQPPTGNRLAQLGASVGFPVQTAALRRLELPTTALESIGQPSVDRAMEDYWRFFGHTTRGTVCACETEYGPDTGFHQPQQLADISGYYLAFGLRFVDASDIRLDHIACECEFMDFLCRKEALLLSDPTLTPDASETLATTRDAARGFLRDHLGRFGCAFAARLASEDPGGFYGALGHLLLVFLQAECARSGVRSGAIDLVVRTADMDEAPVACGSADDLIQIQRRP